MKEQHLSNSLHFLWELVLNVSENLDQLKRVKESKRGFKMKTWRQEWWKSGLNNRVHVKNCDMSEKPQADSNADGSIS